MPTGDRVIMDDSRARRRFPAVVGGSSHRPKFHHEYVLHTCYLFICLFIWSPSVQTGTTYPRASTTTLTYADMLDIA